MKLTPSLEVIAALLLAATSECSRAQADFSPGEPVSLEGAAAKLAVIENEIAEKVQTVRKLVEEEATAKRVSEPVAQSLRWTLHTVSTSSDVRGLFGTLRVPPDNAVLNSSVKELEGALLSAQSRRAALLSAIGSAARERVSEALRSASKLEEVDALISSIEKVRNALPGKSGAPYDPQGILGNSVTVLRGLRKLIESLASEDSVMIGAAVTHFRSLSFSDVGREEIPVRIDRAIAPAVAALDEAQKALDAAIETQKPAAEITAALVKWELVAERTATIRALGSSPRDTRTMSATYQAVVAALTPSEPEDFQGAMERMQKARSAMQQIGGKQAAAYLALFAQREGELAASEVKRNVELQENIRTRLAAVKDPAQLGLIAQEVSRLATRRAQRNDPEQGSWNALAPQLNTLATAWAASSPLTLQSARSGETGSASPFLAELTSLRTRIERDVLSRALRAPELNAPPLADQPLEAAVDTYCDGLAERGEWRRLYQAIEIHGAMESNDPRGRQELLTVVRAFLAGQNFELAEQWGDAAQAYRTVLASPNERAPVRASAERLKAIAKKHPDAIKGLSPSGAPFIPPRGR